jgi:hypothetical protein
MKSIFYNPKKAENEAQEKEVILEEQEKRTKYLQQLSKNRLFQKYVIEEIIDAEIKSNRDLTGTLEGIISATPEELHRIMLAKSAGLKAVQNIKNKLLYL